LYKQKVNPCERIAKEKIITRELTCKEKICIDFKLSHRETKRLLWEAIGVVPSANLLIHNSSTEQAIFLIQRANGSEVTVWVDPKSEIAMTFPDIVRIITHCESPALSEEVRCFGVLTLSVQFPQPTPFARTQA
jgi:hypothetical protein